MGTDLPSAKATESADSGTQITIVRNSSEDTQTRQIIVYLDGENRGELMYGDSMTLPIAPGTHVLRVDNTWNRKDLPIVIRPGEDLRFVTKSSAGKFVWF